MGIATALTAQGERTFAVSPVPLTVLRSQLLAVTELVTVSAVKVGMVAQAGLLRLLFRSVRSDRFRVIDPVTRTSLGQRLSTLRPADYLQAATPKTVLTPNLEEASWLLGRKSTPRGVEEMAWMGERLRGYGFAAVIVKGGHLGAGAVDVLVDGSGARPLAGVPIRARFAPRGTGCRFASVLATALARGESMFDAAREAKARVRDYLRSAREPGSGVGAVR